MSRFIYNTATSVNGFIADPDNSLQWLFDVGGDTPAEFTTFVAGVGVQVMGSTTYEWLLTNQRMLDTPETWHSAFGDLPTRVYTTRGLPRPHTEAFDFMHGPVSEHEAELRTLAGGRDIWIVGGGDLAGQFLDAGLLDQIVVTIAPAFLAGGAPLLPRFVPAASLTPTDVQQQGSFVRITYDVRR